MFFLYRKYLSRRDLLIYQRHPILTSDSILKDLAKIYQEFILGWSSRKLNKNEILRAKTIYNTILDEKFFSGFSKKILKLLKFEILMTLIRIFPYVDEKDIITINWLEYSVNKVLKNYNNLDFS